MIAADRGPVFAAAMKTLTERGKPLGVMKTWRCPECATFHVVKGTENCPLCREYEIRVGGEDV